MHMPQAHASTTQCEFWQRQAATQALPAPTSQREPVPQHLPALTGTVVPLQPAPGGVELSKVLSNEGAGGQAAIA